MAPRPKEPVPIVLAALHPKMLELAATKANGTHPYFVPPEHTAKMRAAIGPKPMICVEQAIILLTDAAKARARARSYMKNYVPRLPNYINNLKNLGWADAEFENGCSDNLVDAIMAWGSEKQIQDRIEAHLKAGATHVCIQPLHPDNDAHPDLKAVEAFARLNKPIENRPAGIYAQSELVRSGPRTRRRLKVQFSSGLGTGSRTSSWSNS